MTSEIRRLRIDAERVDGTWAWVDVVTGERGRMRLEGDGWAEGCEGLVEIERSGTDWRAVRWLQLPEGARTDHDDQRSSEAPRILVDGRPLAHPEPTPDHVPTRSHLAVGAIRVVFQEMDARSTAARDAGAATKSRPAVLVGIDRERDQVEVSFVYGTNSAVRRSGTGRRIVDWRAAGLRKASVLSGAIEVRAMADLGPFIGHLSDRDRARLLE